MLPSGPTRPNLVQINRQSPTAIARPAWASDRRQNDGKRTSAGLRWRGRRPTTEAFWAASSFTTFDQGSARLADGVGGASAREWLVLDDVPPLARRWSGGRVSGREVRPARLLVFERDQLGRGTGLAVLVDRRDEDVVEGVPERHLTAVGVGPRVDERRLLEDV